MTRSIRSIIIVAVVALATVGVASTVAPTADASGTLSVKRAKRIMRSQTIDRYWVDYGTFSVYLCNRRNRSSIQCNVSWRGTDSNDNGGVWFYAQERVSINVRGYSWYRRAFNITSGE